VTSRADRESRSLPVLAKKSTGDSKFDVILREKYGIVSRIIVELMPGLGWSGSLSHGDVAALWLKV
jgi:hypothetical protein